MEDVEISSAKGVLNEGEVQTEELNIPTMEDGRSEKVYSEWTTERSPHNSCRCIAGISKTPITAELFAVSRRWEYARQPHGCE
jgi:hypothetical protein